MTTMLKRVANVALLGALILSTPFGAEGQRRRGRQQAPTTPWPAVSVGPRFGYDNNANGEVLGAQLHIPLLRSARVELMPNGDITFVSRLKEYQFNLEAVVMPGGSRGGVYLGGGLAFRNSVFGSTPTAPRETKQGYSIVAGIRSSSGGFLTSQLEVRWIFLSDSPFNPKLITFGVNFPLWGSRARGGRSR
jgi:hypothetical protein